MAFLYAGPPPGFVGSIRDFACCAQKLKLLFALAKQRCLMHASALEV
jgi:hypothetical protein